MLAAALRRDARDRALEDLQERLLHSLAGDVAGDRHVARGPSDLVDLVDVDDALLRALDLEVGRLEQLQQDVLDVLADVARLGEGRRVRHREGDVEHAGQGAREEGLARARGPDEQDVGLLDLHLGSELLGLAALVAQAVVVVVDRDREDLLRAVLADDVLVEAARELDRGGEALLGGAGAMSVFLPAGAGLGLRSLGRRLGLPRRCSSWRIELQISMHSLQMYTPGGPAMRDATWWRGFSQKVQRSTWRPVRLDELMA